MLASFALLACVPAMTLAPTLAAEGAVAPFTSTSSSFFTLYPTVGAGAGAVLALDSGWLVEAHVALRPSFGMPSVSPADGRVFTSGIPQLTAGAAVDVGYRIDLAPFALTFELGPDVVLQSRIAIDVGDVAPTLGLEPRVVFALEPFAHFTVRATVSTPTGILSVRGFVPYAELVAGLGVSYAFGD